MDRIRKTSQGIGGVYRREIGDLSLRKFMNCLAASENLVLRFGIQRKLNQHKGCVNTVAFNDDGDILISGSDDRTIILWDWDVGKIRLSFHSGHSNNVFQAQFMPFSNDKSIVTSSADGEVRHAMICEGGRVTNIRLSQHAGQVHKLAVELGSPYVFYSCGEDGVVQRFDLRTKAGTLLFVCRDVRSTIVPLNDISVDPRSPNYFAIGGNDRYARLYDIRRYRSSTDDLSGQPCDFFCPHGLVNHNATITGLKFSSKSELLVSYVNENIYLFLKDQGLGTEPLQSQSIDDEECPKIYKGHRNCYTVKGVNFYGPNCDYVVSGSDCGRIFMWRKKDGELLRAMEGDKHVVNCVEPHPYSTTIASCGIEKDIKIWTPDSFEQAPPVDVDAILKADRLCHSYFGAPVFGMDDDDYSDSDDDDDDSNECSEEFVDEDDDRNDSDDGDDNSMDDGGDDDIDDLDDDDDDDSNECSEEFVDEDDDINDSDDGDDNSMDDGGDDDIDDLDDEDDDIGNLDDDDDVNKDDDDDVDNATDDLNEEDTSVSYDLDDDDDDDDDDVDNDNSVDDFDDNGSIDDLIDDGDDLFDDDDSIDDLSNDDIDLDR